MAKRLNDQRPMTASNLNFKAYVIIVAGGTGSRMRSAVPKQFLLLKGKPVLMHTVEAFYHSETKPEIIIALAAELHLQWQQLCTQHHFNIPHQLVQGGETRFHSVKNGLDSIPDTPDSIISVHDAARPLTERRIIDKSYIHATEHGNAVAAVKSRDSVRQVKNNGSASLNREDIYLVQTPQTFLSSQLKQAYLQPYDGFTDDASVVEAAGFTINLIEGSSRNIKITFAEDIAFAEWLMSEKSIIDGS